MDPLVRLKWVSDLTEDLIFFWGASRPSKSFGFNLVFRFFGRFVRLMWVSDLSEDENFCEIPAVRLKWVSDLSEDLLYGSVMVV